MKKIFHLATCNSCQKVLKELDAPDSIELREIKSKGVTETELDAMKEIAGTYEALFSRRAMKYRSLGLKEMELSEDDYRKYILLEYTFLKRPVMVIDDEIFIGHAKKSVQGAKEMINAIK